MPRRTKVEREPIIAMLVETKGDAVETARRLGLHYNTVNQIKRFSAGLCMACGKRPRHEDRAKCIECAEHERVRVANKRKSARKRGQCSMCPKPLRKRSALYCEEHYWQTFERQRVHRILDKYGPEALEFFNNAEHRCTACGITQKAKTERGDDVRIHLHHIDGDHGNTDPANFAIMCADCHWVTHRLLLCRDRLSLVAWFEKTYPAHPLR